DVPLLDRGLASPEQRCLRVVVRELLRLAAHGVTLDGLGERGEAPLHSSLERTTPTERVGLVVDPAAWDGLAVKPVALVVVDLRDRRVDRDLVEVRPAEPAQLRVE